VRVERRIKALVIEIFLEKEFPISMSWFGPILVYTYIAYVLMKRIKHRSAHLLSVFTMVRCKFICTQYATNIT
jgi:hypothetical protein